MVGRARVLRRARAREVSPLARRHPGAALAAGAVLALAKLALPGAVILVAFLPPSWAQTEELNVTNVAPVVVSVSLPGSATPTAGTTTSVSTTIVVQDINGYNDISSVTLEVLKPDGSTTHIASSAATFSSSLNTTDAQYTKSFSMNFYDDSALTTSTYKVKIVVTDAGGLTGNNLLNLAVFNYNQLVALNLAAGTLDFGTNIEPASTSATQSASVQNYGNVQIDVQLNGTTLTHESVAASIAVGYLNYSLNSDMSSKSSLTSSPVTLSSFDLVKGASSSRLTYYALTVPSGSDQWVPSGNYTGTLTVGAVAG